MGMFDGADEDVGTPQLTDDEKMAIAMLGQMPEMYDSPSGGMAPGAGGARPPVMPQPVVQPPPTAMPAAGGNGMPPMGPPDESTYPVPPPNLAAASTPRAMPPVMPGARTAAPTYKSPFVPPQVDMGARDKLVAARDATRGAAPDVKHTWKDYLRAAIIGFTNGYSRDPNAVGRGVGAGLESFDQPQDAANAAQTRANQVATDKLQDFDTRSGIERTQFEDTLKGENAETSRLSEQNRANAESRAAAAMGTEIDKGFNGGKPTKMKGEDGKDHYFMRTKDGHHIEVDAPDKKVAKTAYERSQSDDPKEAAQGRKDYDREEQRRDTRTANDTTRANAAKENADKKGAKGAGKSDPATRHYNDKVDKARKSMNDSIAAIKALPNWQDKPVFKNQVKQAYDDFNDNVASYHSEYQDEAGDKATVVAPARIPYPWEKGGSQSASAPSSDKTIKAISDRGAPAKNGTKPNATSQPSSDQDSQGNKLGKPVTKWVNPKSGKTYQVGDTVKDGKFTGKTIKTLYDNGRMGF